MKGDDTPIPCTAAYQKWTGQPVHPAGSKNPLPLGMGSVKSLKDDNCNRALKRIVPRVNISAIQQMINATPFLSDLQKEFHCTMVEKRFECILNYSYKSLAQQAANKKI